MSREMRIKTGALAAVLAMGMSALPITRNDGIARSSYGHPGSPKRNQERSVKRMAKNSRSINRARKR